MHPSFERSLLRRTLSILAALASLLVAAPAFALTVTLSGASGSSCTYTGMSVAPDGNVTVNCDTGTVVAGQPGTFSLAVTSSMNINSSATASVSRSGGTTGAINVAYSVSGAACAAASGNLAFADGSASSSPVSFTVNSGGAAGTCIVAITPSGGSTGTGTVTISVVAPPPPTNNAACPAGFTPPADLINATFPPLGNPLKEKQKSGQIVSLQLPAVVTYSKQAVFSESTSTYTPQPVTLEITISQCPGYIDVDTVTPTNTHPNNNYCNLKSTNGSYNSIVWFGKAYSVLNSASSANKYQYCWAPEGDAAGPYYLNARWTYGSCPFGQSTCGFAIQQNLGPY